MENHPQRKNEKLTLNNKQMLEIDNIAQLELMFNSNSVEKQNNTKKLFDYNNIYPNQRKFAKKIAEALVYNDIIIAKAAMQYGKTGSLYHLCNCILRHLLAKNQNIAFITAMTDTTLLLQNIENLQKKRYYDEDGESHLSKIQVIRMTPDFRNNFVQLMTENKFTHLIFDECDYGSGNKSLFNIKFFEKLKECEFNVKLILMSATPYCALNAVYSGELDAEIVEAEIPINYFGVNSMLDNNMVIDIKNYYGAEDYEVKEHFTYTTEDGSELSYEMELELERFVNQDGGGLAILRTKDSFEAKALIPLFEGYSEDYEVISIGVNSTPIKEILGSGSVRLTNKIINNDKKVLLVVVNALSAGKDLGELKDYVRLIIETRERAIANGSQGLVGRICGYHKNRNIRIIASLDVLKNYARLENNASIMADEDFINETIALKLDFSTQLSKARKAKNKMQYKVDIQGPFTIDDVKNKTHKLFQYFPSDDTTYGEFKILEDIIVKGKEARGAINSQRRGKYGDSNKKVFDVLWNDCMNGSVDFGNRFHRFRAESGDEEAKLKRLRIKTGVVLNDDTASKEFFLVFRKDDGVKVKINGTLSNKSCYGK